MPSFPDSVWAPSAKSAGQTIQPAHVNDAQDEIVAIEGGYRNGTAPLNSSGSTLVTLSVTGGSTLASLDVNGNSTFASSITFGSLPYVMPSSGGSTGQALTIVSTSGSTMTLEWRASAASGPDAAHLTIAAAVEVPASTLNMSWTEQTFLTNSSMHSTATNADRVTPQSTGVYMAVFKTWWEGPSTYTKTTIFDSSGTAVADAEHRNPAGSVSQVVTGFKRFDVTGGWLRASVQAATSTNSLNTGAGRTTFTVVKL